MAELWSVIQLMTLVGFGIFIVGMLIFGYFYGGYLLEQDKKKKNRRG